MRKPTTINTHKPKQTQIHSEVIKHLQQQCQALTNVENDPSWQRKDSLEISAPTLPHTSTNLTSWRQSLTNSMSSGQEA